MAAAQQMPMVEELASPVILTAVRFGQWKYVLQEKAPPPGFAYSNVIWHYALGGLCFFVVIFAFGWTVT
ncbi:MAG TPA: hypothetical protein VMA09_02025 [Candidatus Binataceae bacterium]|nr:hypothetical protein [Candidatus Binataceae bacterium]